MCGHLKFACEVSI